MREPVFLFGLPDPSKWNLLEFFPMGDAQDLEHADHSHDCCEVPRVRESGWYWAQRKPDNAWVVVSYDAGMRLWFYEGRVMHFWTIAQVGDKLEPPAEVGRLVPST